LVSVRFEQRPAPFDQLLSFRLEHDSRRGH
jgi:hypothetical protein